MAIAESRREDNVAKHGVLGISFEYMLAHIEDGAPVAGPLDPSLSLVGQRMIDSAVLSAARKRSVSLVQ
jgi:hypothetical protein